MHFFPPLVGGYSIVEGTRGDMKVLFCYLVLSFSLFFQSPSSFFGGKKAGGNCSPSDDSFWCSLSPPPTPVFFAVCYPSLLRTLPPWGLSLRFRLFPSLFLRPILEISFLMREEPDDYASLYDSGGFFRSAPFFFLFDYAHSAALASCWALLSFALFHITDVAQHLLW